MRVFLLVVLASTLAGCGSVGQAKPSQSMVAVNATRTSEMLVEDMAVELSKLPPQEVFDCMGVADVYARLATTVGGNALKKQNLYARVWKRALLKAVDGDRELLSEVTKNSFSLSVLTDTDVDGEDVRAHLTENSPKCRDKRRAALEVVKKKHSTLPKSVK